MVSETGTALPDMQPQQRHTAREIIDPEHTLPSVEFNIGDIDQQDDYLREAISIIHDGHPVGHCDLISEYGQKAHFDGIEIDEAKQGGGFGLATYLKAIEIAHERNLPFETQDVTQTKGARKIWLIMAQAGLAEEIEPFRALDYDGFVRYVGKYRVPVLAR